ncbi:cation diffusion facilitator family transporter [Sphingopyxis alaskensis]|uniref:Cation diffusion facilitator family transporter n=1 Tax=Sphingopyxis alaskensis (strain DSM 13593 / LMG 18877 / RB2256) TaxID=317655 RepID=Q1GPY2_SPHAL|nr:cation diffusion facilitator family transporter [Sphingopyxis alaskensis]ABF54290.1 cation diffusion facilitator family transporter [Sphingopyxis alaskensis RB2256]MCM3417998.1 cation diffusion facilitator family transporter [Sphingopyxis alaskensis]
MSDELDKPGTEKPNIAAPPAHDHGKNANSRRLLLALILTGTFLVAEVVGSFVFNSLALLSDAGHMLTDVAALIIALMAIRIGARPADDQRTFGYRRFEILAAAFNALMLFAVAIYVLVEALNRFRDPEPVQSTGMLVVAVAGLAINLISMRLLSSGKEQSLNLKGAYLEVWADMLGSIGVIAGAIAIRFTGATWIDPVVAVGIGLWVLPRTWILLRDTANVLLEGVPRGMSLDEVRRAISEVSGVQSAHDLHVWSITTGNVSCSVHIVVEDIAQAEPTRTRVAQMLAQAFQIGHATIQTESKQCAEARSTHS